MATSEHIVDPSLGINISLHRGWLSEEERRQWWNAIVENVQWHRVKYKSNRFKTQCETPCWTTFFGGDPAFTPYTKIPAWLMPLVVRVSKLLLQYGQIYNAILVRLYFDGKDEIAWHTDGRKFLGKRPTIGSLSLGAPATFEMRRMHNCWPCVSGTAAGNTHDDGIDRTTPIKSWRLGNGDLFSMKGETQDHWHHRVPKEKGRRPRININFRMILPNQRETEGGQKTYYKYMVHGDSKRPPQWTYQQLLRKHNSLLGMLVSNNTNNGSNNNEGSKVSEEVGLQSSSQWSCPKCTFLNNISTTRCKICCYQAIKKKIRSGEPVVIGGKIKQTKIKHKHNTILNMFTKNT